MQQGMRTAFTRDHICRLFLTAHLTQRLGPAAPRIPALSACEQARAKPPADLHETGTSSA